MESYVQYWGSFTWLTKIVLDVSQTWVKHVLVRNVAQQQTKCFIQLALVLLLAGGRRREMGHDLLGTVYVYGPTQLNKGH